MKRDRPYFLWDLDVNDAELRARLEVSDPDTRAQWQARVMREARYDDVWSYLTVERIVRDWDHIILHLGRRRPFWEYLLRKWRDDGLLPAA
jgi:hypothetical protein